MGGFNWKLALTAQAACILEVDAPKVGNVNRFHDFADASLEDFHCSSLAVGYAFGRLEELGVGRTIYEAVRATRKVVSTNTNLGIILLLAPLGMAWCRVVSKTGASNAGELSADSWATEIRVVLDNLGTEDTAYVYDAIRLVSAGGIGHVAQYDVYQDDHPRITLVQAMELASEYDLVARQYVNGFATVLHVGYAAMKHSLAEGLSFPEAVAHTHLFLLSEYQDSLITRKLGPASSSEVQRRVSAVWNHGGWLTPGGREQVLELDRWLREDGHGLNPGTTADLMAAVIFVFLLQYGLIAGGDSMEKPELKELIGRRNC